MTERLTVKLNDGQTLYFTAGSILGDTANRLDMLRNAIENDSVFRSSDLDGVERKFLGSAVAHYHVG